MKYLSWLIVFVLSISLVACPPAQKKPAAATSAPESAAQTTRLRYKFPVGAVNKYRTDEEGYTNLNISSVNSAQSVKAVTSAVIREKVLQPPIDGYAFIEQAIESYDLKVWQNDKIIFDSSRFRDFSGGPDANAYLNLKGKVFKFEMNEFGAIRNIQGLGDIKFGQNSLDSLKMLESGYPIFPEGEITVGQTWENKREIPFTPTEGYRGVLKINETSTLKSLSRENNKLLATIVTKRDMIISVSQTSSNAKMKGFDGSGQLVGSYVFDVNAGRIISGDSRTNLKVTANLGVGAKSIETSIDMNMTAKMALIGN